MVTFGATDFMDELVDIIIVANPTILYKYMSDAIARQRCTGNCIWKEDVATTLYLISWIVMFGDLTG